MTTLTIRLPEALKAQLDEISRDENKAVSDIVRESLRRYIAVEQEPPAHQQVGHVRFVRACLAVAAGQAGRGICRPRSLDNPGHETSVFRDSIQA